jgi:osmoprotectant transport system ATP-binding protein
MQDMLRTVMMRMKKTVLLVTHDLNEALYLGNRIVLVSEGRLIANLTPKDFIESAEPQIKAYVRAFYRGEQEAREKRQA